MEFYQKNRLLHRFFSKICWLSRKTLCFWCFHCVIFELWWKWYLTALLVYISVLLTCILDSLQDNQKSGENQKIVRNMESWGSSKSLEASTKLKLLFGGTILPNFSVKIFTVLKILQIKECTKCRPRIYWPEFKNCNNPGLAQTNSLKFGMWTLWKILCLRKKSYFFS